MRRDQRIATLLGWHVETSEQAIQLLGQMALAYDPAGDPMMRRAALRRIVEARNLLDDAARRRLRKATGDVHFAKSLERLLRPLETADSERPVSMDADGIHARPPLDHDAKPGTEREDVASAADEHAEGPESLEQADNFLQRLTSRISRFQQDNVARLNLPADDFAWTSDADGTIVEGAGRFAVNTSGRLSDILSHAPQAVRALERQLPFHDAPASCNERICRLTGQPRFNAISGRFEGYSGTALFQERSAALPIPETDVSELAHEILTPLNAIVGYAQMIDQQILGPVPDDVRNDAEIILRDAGQLLRVIEALGEQAARRTMDGHSAAEPVDGTALLACLQREIERVLVSRGVQTEFERCGHPLYLSESSRFKRHLRRLLLALASMSEEGETFRVRSDDRAIRIEMPEAVARQPADRLLRYAAPGRRVIDFELLGLSFALRQMRETLEAGNGSLRISAGEIGLYPYAAERPREAAVS